MPFVNSDGYPGCSQKDCAACKISKKDVFWKGDLQGSQAAAWLERGTHFSQAPLRNFLAWKTFAPRS